jgi:cytochrome bd-type quinol oxidase subunit 2
MEGKNIDPMVSLAATRVAMMKLWLIGVGGSAVILVISSILRGQADAAREVWSWFLPLVIPTLGLMVGVLGAAAITRRTEGYVRKSFVDIAYWLSLAYLLLLFLTIALEPFSRLRGAELHGMSNYWMAPFQGLVVAALGYLFTSDEKKSR